MKTCPSCAGVITKESMQCHLCGTFLIPADMNQARADTHPTPEAGPQQRTIARHAGKSKTDVPCKHKAIGEKTVVIAEKHLDTVKKKIDRVLIIAIIVFGILLLVIQFSKHLGIKGFP